MLGPVGDIRLAVKACSLWCMVVGLGLFFFGFPRTDHFYLVVIVTVVQIIIACLLLFFYLPGYQSAIKDDARVKSMHQVIQWWRGLSSFSVVLFTVVTAQVFARVSTNIEKAAYGFLYTLLLVTCLLSFTENYSVVPTSLFPPMVLASPLNLTMALPSPTVITPIRVV